MMPQPECMEGFNRKTPDNENTVQIRIAGIVKIGYLCLQLFIKTPVIMSPRPVLLPILIIFCSNLFSQPSITVRRTFVDSFKNKVTINADYDVWFTHHKAKAAKDDGDIHCSGYDKKIGMPVVAEIMNAKAQADAIEILVDHEGKGQPNNPKVNVTGVWRLWPEHMGKDSRFFQGMKLSKATIVKKTTNPDHVFEIHPVTALEGIDLNSTFMNIEGYESYDVRYAFDKIRKKKFSISADKKTITFSTTAIGYNYMNLWARIDSVWEVEDGALAYCTVLDSDFDPANDKVKDKTVTKKTRIAFAKDTAPYRTALEAGDGKFMHLLGIPRIDMAILSWRVWVSKKRPEVLSWGLPFEIIAAGIIE
jgi:hypothetical protein